MVCGNMNWEYTYQYLKFLSPLVKLTVVEEGKVGAPWETLEYFER